MVSLYRGQVVSASSPALTVSTVDADGLLQDAYAIRYAIYLIGATGSRTPVLTPTQKTLDLEACRLSQGRYFIPWSVPGLAVIGWYEMDYEWEMEDGGETKSATRRLEVTQSNIGLDGSHYCGLKYLRDEGISSVALPDYRAAKLLKRASRDIECWTGLSFRPVYKALQLDRSIGRLVSFSEPIVAIEKIESSALDVDLISDHLEVYGGTTIVYNRHLTKGLLKPDDRRNPHVVLYGSSFAGYQTLVVTGVFGWTDPDGTCEGDTPDDIQHVCAKLVWRMIETIGSEDDEKKLAPFVLSESTSRQSVSFDSRRVGNGPTGDPEIDAVLARYRPPVSLSVV